MAGAHGGAQPNEKAYVGNGGSSVPVMIGVARFEQNGTEGVAFVLALTEWAG